jgi:hypothetical protein
LELRYYSPSALEELPTFLFVAKELCVAAVVVAVAALVTFCDW